MRYRTHLFYLVSLLLLISYYKSSAQAPKIEWAKCYGGSSVEVPYCIQQTSDGGYIAVGFTESQDGDVYGLHDPATGGLGDAWIVKTDNIGKIVWTRTIGGSSEDRLYSIQQTAGGYIAAGYTGSIDGDLTGINIDTIGYGQAWVIKLDTSGKTVWQKCYGGSGDENANSIVQTADSGYIFAGRTNSDDGDVSGTHKKDATGLYFGYDIWVVKITATGAISWQKTLGGGGDETGQSIQQTTDGGYVVAGYTNSDDGDVTKHYGDGSTNDGWVVRLSGTGGLIWQKAYGGTAYDELNAVKQTPDGGYVFTGWTISNDDDVSGDHLNTSGNATDDLWVVKTDTSGGINWQRCYGGSGHDGGNDIQLTADSGFVVTGYTSSSDGDITGYHYDTSHPHDYWVLQLTNSGDINWNNCYGGSGEDDAYSIKVTSDGEYVVAGISSSLDDDVKGNHTNKIGDWWIVKLGSPLAINNVVGDPIALHVYPNPSNTRFIINYALSAAASIEIADVAGKTISNIMLNQNSHEAMVNAASWPSGVYFYKVVQDGTVVGNGKLMKE